MKYNKKSKFKRQPTKQISEEDMDDLDDDYEEKLKWYQEATDEPKSFKSVTEQILIELKDEAKKCHDAEVANYNISKWKVLTSKVPLCSGNRIVARCCCSLLILLIISTQRLLYQSYWYLLYNKP